jgi:hypothetical protein
MKQMLAPERAHDGVLHEIVRPVGIAHERPRESAQGGD